MLNGITKKSLLLLLLFVLLAAIGCDDDDERSGVELSTELRARVTSLGLSGDPSTGRVLPDISASLPRLGMKLFFTKALGGDKDTACATCHHPALGGGDSLSVSIGVSAINPDLLGPGRMHPSGAFTVPRNAPTTFNIAMWDRQLFFDGRVESRGKTPKMNGADGEGIRTPDCPFDDIDPEAGEDLVMAQCRFPVTSDEEMKGEIFEAGNSRNAVRNHLAARIGDYGIGAYELNPNQWLSSFQEGFDSNEDAESLITFDNITRAIAAYERSQVFVDSPWRDFVQGDDGAISGSAKRGALMFFKAPVDGGVGCFMCHGGDFFTDEQFHVMAVPQIGPGKGDGEDGRDDFGRFRESGDPDDQYAFRTPSLLNISETGPYGHSGAYTELPAMVEHMLDPWAAVENYDLSQLDPGLYTVGMASRTAKAVAQLNAHVDKGLTPVRKISLSETEKTDLMAFLYTLTDPCLQSRECLQKWIPDASVDDPDGLRLNAININGETL